MGLRGPKPKPTALRVLEGSRKPSRSEPRPEPASPACPDWLDGEGRAMWDRLAPKLLALGLLTEIDTNALAAYCDEWSEFRGAVDAIREDGRWFKSPAGHLCVHPAVAIRRAAWAGMMKLAACFGMDPASRSKVNVASDTIEDDPMGEFLAKCDEHRQSEGRE